MMGFHTFRASCARDGGSHQRTRAKLEPISFRNVVATTVCRKLTARVLPGRVIMSRTKLSWPIQSIVWCLPSASRLSIGRDLARGQDVRD